MFELIIAAIVCIITIGIIRKCGIWSLPSFASIIFAVGYSVRIVIFQTTEQDIVFDAFFMSNGQYRDMAGYGFIAFLAMCSGIAIGSILKLGKTSSVTEHREPVQYHPGFLLLAAIAAFAAQIVLLSRTFGGLDAAISALSLRVFVGESFAVASALTSVAAPLLIASFVLAKLQGHRTVRFLALAIFAMSLPLMAIVNGRAAVIIAVWAIALASFVEFKKKPRVVAIVGLGALTLATSVVGLAYRSSSQTSQPFASEMQRYLGDSLVISSESLPIFDHTRVGMEYVSAYGSGPETSVFNAFSVLIPRSMWPDKPEFLPQILGERLKYTELSGLPAGLLGEGFINGGWLGAIFFALIFGVLVGLAHRSVSTMLAITPLSAAGVYMAVNTALVGLRTGAQGGLITLQIALVALIAVGFVGWLGKVRGRKLPAAKIRDTSLVRRQ